MRVRDPVNILLVDDQPAKLLTYEVILHELGENLIRAGSGEEAFAHLLKTDVAVVLVDVCMPELDGFELVTMLREHPRFVNTAVIFISAIHQSEYDLLRGYESGAVDYVSVPVVPEVLRAKVRIFVDLYRKTRQLEQLNSELELRVAERTAALENSTIQLRESEERLRLASEAADFGTYDYNIHTDRLHCSPPLKRLLNTSMAGELTLDQFVALCHPDDRDAVRGSMLSAGQNGGARHETEYRVPLAEGQVRWLLDRGGSLGVSGPENEPASRVMGTVVDITERKQAEENQLLLMAELDHRVKNILANVIAMARLSSKGAGSVETFVDALDGRIQAMARAHRLLREGNWSGANLAKLAKVALRPFRSSLSNNIEIRGDALSLNPKLAQSLALALHELATNAVKYGALSAPAGRVILDWKLEDTAAFRLNWQELGGPPVVKPANRGFGLTVLDSVAAETGARIETIFDEQGLRCHIAGPLEPGSRSASANKCGGVRPKDFVGQPTDMTQMEKWRVLIVEDEPLIALHLQAALEGAGHHVVGPAYGLGDGLELASDQQIDIALLDVSLGRELSVPIADHLLAKGIPFVFATGYSDRMSLPEHLKDVPKLTKPYQFEKVFQLLEELVGKTVASGPAN